MTRARPRHPPRHRAADDDVVGGPSGDAPARRRFPMLATLVTGARDVTRLVLPVHCPGCGRWDEVLCGACAALLAGPVRRCEADVPRLDRLDGRPVLPVWAVTAYTGPVRGVVVAWKDRDRADLTTVLAATARRAGREVAPLVAGAAPGSAVVTVPVPSAPGARRRRGADLVAVLADAAAQGLRDGGVPARRASLLARRRGRDQVGLGARARGSNVAGSVRRRPRARTAAGEVLLLVDDVVTTGSTLVTCASVLTTSGAPVLGALVIAATPPPSSRRDRVPDPAVGG